MQPPSRQAVQQRQKCHGNLSRFDDTGRQPVLSFTFPQHIIFITHTAPQDHREQPEPEPQTQPSSPLSKYQDLIPPADDQAAGRRQQLPQQVVQNGVSLALLEADQAAGLGSIGLFAQVRAEEIEMQQQLLTQQQLLAGPRPDGSDQIQRLAANLADDGFDLEGDWGIVQNQTTTTGKSKVDITQPIQLLRPPRNAKVGMNLVGLAPLNAPPSSDQSTG